MSNSKTQGGVVKCINTKPLPGNSVAPPLKLDETYVILQVIHDKKIILILT